MNRDKGAGKIRFLEKHGLSSIGTDRTLTSSHVQRQSPGNRTTYIFCSQTKIFPAQDGADAFNVAKANIAEGTVSSRLSRAREKLQKELKGDAEQ